LRTVVPLHAKQAKKEDTVIKRPVFFVERAQCNKEHQLFIKHKVFATIIRESELSLIMV
jgi:hypothetical protein